MALAYSLKKCTAKIKPIYKVNDWAYLLLAKLYLGKNIFSHYSAMEGHASGDALLHASTISYLFLNNLICVSYMVLVGI